LQNHFQQTFLIERLKIKIKNLL